MKPHSPLVPVFTISEINFAADKEKSGNQFHVTRSNELVDPPKYARPVKGDSFAFILATAGTTHIKYNLLDYQLTVNGLFIISPGIIHEMHTGENGQLIGLGFSQDFFAESLIHKKHMDVFSFLFSHSDPYFQLSTEEAALLYNLMLILKKSHSDSEHPFKEDVMFHGFNLFMLEAAAIFKKHRHLDSVRLTRKEELLINFLKLLSIHFKMERSVQFYAGQLFVTPKHLTKTIKELTNKTVGQFIDEMVIAEAKILLDTSSLSVANVADELNFSDQFFFSKFFKNHTGITPSKYKITAM